MRAPVMLPRARIAGVSWRRRLLAWVRGRRIAPVLSPPTFKPYTDRERDRVEWWAAKGVHVHVFGKRCPSCDPDLRAMVVGYFDSFDILAHNLKRVGYEAGRPAPTSMPGPGERVSR